MRVAGPVTFPMAVNRVTESDDSKAIHRLYYTANAWLGAEEW